MKILYINAVAKIASTGRTVMEISKYMQGKGHSTYIVYSEGTLDFSEGYHMDNRIDKKIHALLSRISGLVGYYSTGETKKLIEKIEKWQPDIVQLDNLHSNYVNIPMLIKYLAKNDISTVIVLHDCFMFTGKCCHYTITDCYRWQRNCGHCPRVRDDNKSWFFDKTEKMLSDKRKLYQSFRHLAVIGVSKWILEQANHSVLNCAGYETFIYNWVDVDVFKPMETRDLKRKLGLSGRYIILGVSSGWSDSKGLSDFIKISGKLQNDEIIILVGSMPSDIKLPDNIISVEATNDIGELAKYYAMSDVFLNLSIEETFGKVTAEALACGTPAIVYNTTACPELVGPDCGAVVHLHDIDEVYRQIKKIKKKSKLFYEKTCRQYAELNFNKNKNIAKYEDVYKKMMNDGSKL